MIGNGSGKRASFLLLALACALLAFPGQHAPLMAAQDGPGGNGRQEERKEATDITADDMKIDDENNVIVFSGNVRARKGETRLSAERLEVFTEKRKDGDEGTTTRMRQWIATGNVRIEKGGTVITGQRAVMDVKRDTVTVTGDVVVKQPDSTIRGQKLVTNLKTNVTRIIAGGKGRVRGVFR